jgi:hypothetical protein
MTATAAMFVGIRPAEHATALAGSLRYFAPVLAVFALLCMGIWFGAYVARRRDTGGDEPRDGGRGRGPGRDPTPQGPSLDTEAPWWPDFERQFAAYVKEVRHPVATA